AARWHHVDLFVSVVDEDDDHGGIRPGLVGPRFTVSCEGEKAVVAIGSRHGLPGLVVVKPPISRLYEGPETNVVARGIEFQATATIRGHSELVFAPAVTAYALFMCLVLDDSADLAFGDATANGTNVGN